MKKKIFKISAHTQMQVKHIGVVVVIGIAVKIVTGSNSDAQTVTNFGWKINDI